MAPPHERLHTQQAAGAEVHDRLIFEEEFLLIEGPADIRFEAETGGRATSGNFQIDNRRLIEEFGLQYRPLRQRVKEVINDIRVGEGLPPVA